MSSWKVQLAIGGALVVGGLFYLFKSNKQDGEQEEHEEVFDFNKKKHVLRLLKKLRKVYYQYNNVLSIHIAMSKQKYRGSQSIQELGKLSQEHPVLQNILQARRQQILSYFNIQDYDVEDIQIKFKDDPEVIERVKFLEDDRIHALKGEPIEAHCQIPEKITEEVMREINTQIMIVMIDQFREELLKNKETAKNMHPMMLIGNIMTKLEESDIKADLLEEYGFEDEEYEEPGDKIFESALNHYLKVKSFADFMKQVNVKQIMAIQIIFQNPDDKQSVDEFLSQEIPPQELLQMERALGMAPGGPMGGGMPPGGMDPYGGMGGMPPMGPGGMDPFGGMGGPGGAQPEMDPAMMQQLMQQMMEAQGGYQDEEEGPGMDQMAMMQMMMGGGMPPGAGGR